MKKPGEIRPEPDEYLPYYQRYVSLVRDGDVLEALESQIGSLGALLDRVDDSKAGYRYEADKWSVRELIGHVSDSERVFSYRALRFARNDSTPLAGYEQDDFVRAATFDTIPLAGLTKELRMVREGTILLFKHMQPEAWTRRGVANDGEVSVRALAWIIAGHGIYHEEILRTRYGLT